MALGTLGYLRGAVLLTRSDMTARFTDILTLAEQRIYYGGDGVPPLRIRDMESTADLSFSSGSATLPAGYLDKRALYWPGTVTIPVTYEPPNLFYGLEHERRGEPYAEAYTIEGNSVKVSPSLSGTAKLLHYSKAEAMVADDDTNVILTTFPGVYLYGCQVELYRMTRDATQEQFSLRRYADAVSAANSYTLVSRTLGGGLKKRVGLNLTGA